MTTPTKPGAGARPGWILGLGLVALLLSAFLLSRHRERPGERQRTSPTAAGTETPRLPSSTGTPVAVPGSGTNSTSTPASGPVKGCRLTGQIVFPVAKEEYSSR